MNLSFTEEQLLLGDSIRKWLGDNYGLAARNALAATPEGFSREHWRTFAKLGWLAVPFAEEYGGIGGDAIDVMLVMEEFGKGLVVEPWLATVVMFGAAISEGGREEQKRDIIPRIVSGELMGAWACAEEQAYHNDFDIRTTAVRDGDCYRISGRKSVVLSADTADRIIVTTRTAGGQSDARGISLFMLDRRADGLEVEGYPTVDGLRAAEIRMEGVRVPAADMIGALDQGASLVTRVAGRAILAISAEAVGTMEALYKSTIDYTKQREQFGHPLSDFQVLKHRMTEMFMEHSLAKSLCMKAAMLEARGAAEARRTIHALKYLIGKSGRFVSQNAVQLHGGMGMTEELAIAHYFKRLMIVDAQFGNSDYHLAQFVA